MKHIFLSITTVLVLLISSTIAKAGVYGEGAKILNVGIGLGSPYIESTSTISLPPIHASFEYGLTENISLGGLIGYTSSTFNAATGPYGLTGYNYTWTYSYLIIGVRSAYHYEINDQCDLYGGLMLGYDVASAKFSSNDPNTAATQFFTNNTPSVGGLAFGLYGGIRYMFTDHIGGFAELGYNISWLSVGVTFKL